MYPIVTERIVICNMEEAERHEISYKKHSNENVGKSKEINIERDEVRTAGRRQKRTKMGTSR